MISPSLRASEDLWTMLVSWVVTKERDDEPTSLLGDGHLGHVRGVSTLHSALAISRQRAP